MKSKKKKEPRYIKGITALRLIAKHLKVDIPKNMTTHILEYNRGGVRWYEVWHDGGAQYQTTCLTGTEAKEEYIQKLIFNAGHGDHRGIEISDYEEILNFKWL